MAAIKLTRMQDERLRTIANSRDADWSHSPVTSQALEDFGLVQRGAGNGNSVVLTPAGRAHLGIQFKPGVRNLERQADAILARADVKKRKRC